MMGDREFLYAVVASGAQIYSSYAKKPNPAIQRHAEGLLAKLPKNEVRASVTIEDKLYHYVVDRLGLVTLVVATSNVQKRLAFLWLDEIRSAFTRKYGTTPPSSAAEFGATLKEKMDTFNKNPTGSDKTTMIRNEVDSVKQTMMENLDKEVQRGERLDVMVQKTEALQEESSTFHGNAVSLRRAACVKNAKLTIILVVIILVVILVIGLAIGCSVSKTKCK